MAPELLGCRLDHCQSPLLAMSKARRKSFAPPALPGLIACPTPKETVTQGDVEGATSPPGLPRLPVSLFQRAVPSTPAPGRVHMSVASPSRAAFPGSQAGRHPRLHFRGLLRLHSNYGPLDRSTAQGGLCHRASVHPVTRTNRLPATRSNRQLSGWFLPPLVIRAFWAHYDLRSYIDANDERYAACRPSGLGRCRQLGHA